MINGSGNAYTGNNDKCLWLEVKVYGHTIAATIDHKLRILYEV